MEILVTSEWLAQHLGRDDIAILDASAHLPQAGRDASAEFEHAHIPTARFCDLASLVDETSSVPKALPRKDQIEARLGALGVKSDQHIILYDDSMLRSSARAFFILRMAGITHVSILDGGLEKWRAEARPLETGHSQAEPSRIEASDFHAPSYDQQNIRSKADMLAICASGEGTQNEQIIDARDAARFTGEISDQIHGLPGGHIPGARNLFFRDLLAEDGTFLPVPEIAAAFQAAGINPAAPMVASCGSGMTASVVLFAHQLLDHSHGSLYDGSWSEWGADDATPKESGEAQPI